MLPSLPRIRKILRPENSLPETPPNERPQRRAEDAEKESTSPIAPIDPFEGLVAEPEPEAPASSNQGEETSTANPPPPAKVDSTEKPPLLTKTASDPTIEDVEFLRGIGREAQVWTTYVKETKEFDEDMVDGWNRSLDVTLVFAALFSAILTAFVLESAKQLEPDRADQTVVILREISRALQANGAQNALIDQPDPASDAEFHPKRYAIWVNCLWFLSLSLSIAVSLAAMLAKQWCYYYLSARNGDTITQAEERQKRYGGLAKWRMRGILEHLPMLIHIALALFSVGLILYLWDINVAVASTVSAVSVSALFFYLSTIFLPVWDIFCPFKTTQSVYARIILDDFTHRLPSFRAQDYTVQDPQIRAFLQTFLSPFRTIKVWVANQISRPSPAQEHLMTQPSESSVPERPMAMHPHTIDVIPPDTTPPPADPSSPPSPNEEAQPFVKDALEWLILNSQKSSSIDTAIGALAIGKVPFENDDLKHQIDLHLVKHFSDCFIDGREGVKLQLSHHQNALKLALDYVNWMTYFAGGDPSKLTERVLSFNSSLGSELWTRLGLAFARQVFSLADHREISADVGRNVAFWLSSFIICYSKHKRYLSEEVLSTLIDGLTIAGRNVDSAAPKDRAKVLAIPHLIDILWIVSDVGESVLRSSIGLNLAVFALTTDLPYSINKHSLKSAADHLAYNYRSREDRNDNFTSFTVFALLGFVHPGSKLDLDHDVLGTMTKIIHETRYLARPKLSIHLPTLVESYSLRRRLTSMLVESMIQTTNSSPTSRRYLLRTAYRRAGIAREWEEQPFPSTMHAIHCLITSHLSDKAVLYDDAIVAATDLLYKKVQKLKGLDTAIIRRAGSDQPQSDIEPSRENPGHEGAPETETPERMASTALGLIMEKSNNKQCLEIAVRAVLFHTNRCNVGLVIQATRWFASTFNTPKYNEGNLTDDQLLHMCGYARILLSMASHCPNPGDLAESLHGSGEASSDVSSYKIVEEKLQLLSTKASDTHVHAFGLASLAMWKFGCPDKTYNTETTQGALNDVWELITKHTDHASRVELLRHSTGHQAGGDILRPEAIEVLVDATVMLVAITNPTRSISHLEVQALLRLLGQFRSDTKESVRPALAVALTFWGLSLDADDWDFWTIKQRKEQWRIYTQPEERNKDIAALFLLGLSRILAHYEQLVLNHESIKTIALEIDHYMHQHAGSPDTLTLPFLTEFDVRRHVRESVRTYLQKTESDGPFTKSTSASRDKLRSALQYDGGEGFWYEVPHPLALKQRERGVSFSSE